MSRFPRWSLAALVLVMLVLVAGGAWFYHAQEEHLRQHTETELQAIAQLKVDQIVAWRDDQLAQAAEVAENPFFRAAAARWLADPRAEDAEQILDLFRSLQKYYQYHDVFLVDREGQVRLSLSDRPGVFHEEMAMALSAALRDREPVLGDLHISEDDPTPHLSFVAPLLSEDGPSSEPVGAVILRSDARQFLYPLIQSWPVPSLTAESLLVRREGEEVLFLNDLRHRSDTALKLRIPLTERDVPAVMAVLGQEGIVRGKDYRGVEVLAVLKRVPDTSWFLVAKIDAAEAFADWRTRSVLILALILGLTAFAGAAGLFAWQRNQKAHYRAMYEAEAALRASEARYRVTLMSVGDGVIATDREGRVELLSPMAEALTGWTQDTARGRPLEEVFHIVNEETGRPVESPVARVLREGVVVGLANHTVLIARDGTARPIADSGAPIRNAQNEITGVVLVFRDQTGERAAQRALQESQRTLSTLMNNLPGMAYRCRNDASWTMEFVSEGCLSLTGLPPGHLVGNAVTSYADLIHPEDRQRVWEEVQQAVAERLPFVLEYRIRTAGGEERWVWEKGVAVDRGPEGATVLEGFITDITERKVAEAEIARARDFYLTLLEDFPTPIWRSGVDAKCDWFNRTWLQFTGRTMEQELGDGWTEGVHPEDLERCVTGYLDAFHRREPFRLEYRLRRYDGEYRWIVDFGRPYQDLTGEFAGYIGSCYDTTDQRRAEEQLLSSQRMEAVGRLAGGIAHDFNNMLSVINGYADFALAALRENDPVRAEIQQIRQAGERAATLTRQLLAFSRKQILNPQVLNLNKVVKDLGGMLRRLIGEDIELVTMLADDLGSVKVDLGQIEQVIMNLAINARDAMPNGGKLTIETKNVELDEHYASRHMSVEPGSYVMLAISDTGVGMDEATLARIFEPFFTTKEMGKGTGLGLSTVYGIVKQSGGNIWAYSEVGKGATFKVYLPRVKEAVHEALPQRTESPARGTETILVVEDEEVVRSLVKRILTAAGYQVLTAANGREALRLCEQHNGSVHLMLTDVVMPGLSGRELAEQIGGTCPGMKVLYMSGYTDNAIVHHGVLEEGAHFIGKPFTAADLTRKVREVLSAGDAP